MPRRCRRPPAGRMRSWFRPAMDEVVDEPDRRPDRAESQHADEGNGDHAQRGRAAANPARVSCDQCHQEQPFDEGGNQRGARRRSSGKRMVSTMAVTTAPAIGQRDSAYADPCDSGSLGSDAWCLDTSGAAGRRFVGSDRDLNREEVRALRGDEIGVVRIRHDPVPFELSTAEVGLIGPSALPTTLPPTCRAWIPRRE
jgi:hypothetical protein